MRRNVWLLWMVLASLALRPVIAGAQSIEQLYQDGQHKEEILGDLQAAIESYQKAVEKHLQNRQTAVQAQFRIGRCHEKLGNAEEATQAYRRLLHEFTDQHEVVNEARIRLVALG